MKEKEVCYAGDLEMEKQEVKELENERVKGDGVSYSKGCGHLFTIICC